MKRALTIAGRLIGDIVFLLIACFVALTMGVTQTFAGKERVVQATGQDEGSYYRLKVKLTYKNEPQDFDLVVGCKVPYHLYGDVNYVGMVPTVFGRKMSDGKGLVVRPPLACDGQTTANGEVQSDLLPLIVVYDDADTLAFGTAYLSEDAYESPLSVLKFGGATIEKATQAEFNQFSSTQKNLVKRKTFWSHSAVDVRRRMGLPIVAVPFGQACDYYVRFRLPDELRAVVRQRWPVGRPNYWIANSLDDENYLRRLINSSIHLQSDGTEDRPRRPQQIGGGNPDSGFPTRAGGGMVASKRNTKFQGAYYPATYGDRADKWPVDPQEQAHYFAAQGSFDYLDIDVRGGLTKGFGYCAARVSFDRATLLKKLTTARIDGQPVWQNASLPLLSVTPPVSIFERNEFVFLHFDVSVGPSGGDVQ